MATREVTTSSSAGQSVAAAGVTQDYTRPLAIVTTLFFMWGFLTCLNDILVPHLKAIFDLNFAQVMLVQFAFFSAYFLFSVPWSKIVNRIGYQRTMVAGLLTMAVGALLFVPAATVVSYPLILSAAPLAVEQIRQLAPQALHAYRVQEAASVKMPYTVISVALVLLAILIGTFKLPKIETAADRPGEKVKDSIWKHRNLLMGAIGIFAYVGAEVSIGSFLVNYFGLPEIAGFSAKTAAGFVSFYWAGSMIGRFLGAPLLRRIKAEYLLALCAICATALITASMILGGHTAMWTILSVGLFNSIMFPTIFSLGVAELGPLTGNGSGVMNMAIVGGAILPVIQGFIADYAGLHHAFILPVICYLYILYFALIGSKPNSHRYIRA